MTTPEVVLVSLATWQFACPPDGPRFKDLLRALNGYAPNGEGATGVPGRLYDLRVPQPDGAFGPFGATHVPLRHQLRNGQRTVSWYRGPLGRGPGATTIADVAHSDELLGQDAATKMFDVSYSAAWELGRLLTLANKHVAAQLFLWKRRHARAHRLSKREDLFRGHGSDSGSPNVPDSVRTWFEALRLLTPVPFPYLVPDERLLPPESVRFFEVDPVWVAQLHAGAFTIGHVAGTGAGSTVRPVDRGGLLSGFLLRSSVVTNWPQLLIDGWSVPVAIDSDPAPSAKLTVVRRDVLAPGILLCLFEGDLRAVDFHTKPESLHYGFAEDQGAIRKYPRGKDGVQSVEPLTVPIDPRRRIGFARWVEQSVDFTRTSADFALGMIEGVDRVRFVRTQ